MTVEAYDSPVPPAMEVEKALQLRIDELEQKLRQRDEQLQAEKERGEKARKKVKQLLSKLGERDARLAEQSEAIDELKAALRDVANPAASSGSTEKAKRRSKRSETHTGSSGHRSGQQGRDNAIRERAEIVRQLEGHLKQMRSNLAESERELLELEEMKLMKEAEWNAEGGAPSRQASHEEPLHAASASHEGGAAQRASASQVHFQRQGMIAQQLQEKRRFAAELTQKTEELEDQLAHQRALIDDLHRASSGSGDERGKSQRASVDYDAAGDVIEAGLRASVALAAAEFAATRATSRAAGEELELDTGHDRPDDGRRDVALQAFLEAAGTTAEVILARPALHAAFETRPLELSVGALDDCSSEERLQAVSLFVAYAALSGDPDAPRALRLSDIGLRLAEAVEIGNTLQSCGASLEEWEMTRCPTNEATMRTLLKHLTSHPLRQLNLGYNALGPVGASTLMTCSGAWSSHLERMSLEMNGLGDAGCAELAQALAGGRLPALQSLELGWNELSAACAGALAGLLAPRQQVPDAGAAASAGGSSAPRLRKLGLGGNKLSSDGACALVDAALACPEMELELDLSMNHVGVAPVSLLADWVERGTCSTVAISVVLEWNIIDDAKAVTRLIEAVSRSPGLTSLGRPLARLGNNELHELRAQDVFANSKGFVSC